MRVHQCPIFGFPDLWARSVQAARMAEAFLNSGVDATLVYPWVGGALSWPEAEAAYGVRRRLPRTILAGSRISAFRPLRPFRRTALAASLAAYAMAARSTDVFMARLLQAEPVITLLALKSRGLMRARLVVELHDARHFSRDADPWIDGYVVVTEALAAFLRAEGVEESRVLVARNAVDLRAAEELAARDRSGLRRELGLPESGRLVCYTGQLYEGRNVEAIIAALAHLPASHTVVIVGGHVASDVRRVADVAARAGVAGRVRLVGQQPAAAVAAYQSAADVLVIPYDPVRTPTAAWCSPLKLGEYLASGVPIAAFDLPAFREVLRDDEVVWARDTTATALASAIDEAGERPRRDTAEVRERLGSSTWAHRARRIVEFIGRPSGRRPSGPWRSRA